MKYRLLFYLFALLVGASPGFAAGLILNEFNAVGSGKQLSGTDSFFGFKDGNGGNWVELVVTTDHLDISGWTLEWDNADPASGSVTFTGNSLWTDLRSGTIITIREDDTGDAGNLVGARPTDASYNPAGNDWWIEINVDDASYVTNGGFKVDNDDWEMRILDASSTVQQGYVGEAVPGWGAGGISSTEVGWLTATPTAVNPSLTYYSDGSSSSYGAPNTGQDFSALRSVVAAPEPGSLVLAAMAGAGILLGVWRRRGR